jgi:hypothetical protein
MLAVGANAGRIRGDWAATADAERSADRALSGNQKTNAFRFFSMRGSIGVSPYSNSVLVICSYMAM